MNEVVVFNRKNRKGMVLNVCYFFGLKGSFLSRLLWLFLES